MATLAQVIASTSRTMLDRTISASILAALLEGISAKLQCNQTGALAVCHVMKEMVKCVR